MPQGGSLYSGNAADASSVKSNYQPCLAANMPCVLLPTAGLAVAQLPVHSQEVTSSSTTGNAAAKLSNQTEGAATLAVGADGRQTRSDPLRGARPPTKDRRRTTATVFSPKKTPTSTSDKLDSAQWTTAVAKAIAARRHQQQKQPLKKKTESTTAVSLYSEALISHAGCTAAPQVAWSGLHPANAAPASAPVFTALPATGVLLHGAVPVTARRGAATCPGRVLQPVDRHRHQHVLVADQPTTPCGRLYRPSLSTAGPSGHAAGWGYAAAAPAVAPRHPAVCHEYLLFGPSSVLLLR